MHRCRGAVLKLLASEQNSKSDSEVVESLAEFGFDQSALFACVNEITDVGWVFFFALEELFHERPTTLAQNVRAVSRANQRSSKP